MFEALNEFKEECAICDSENTVINHSMGLEYDDVSRHYPFLYIECLDCGLKFVNMEISDINYHSRMFAKKKLENKNHTEIITKMRDLCENITFIVASTPDVEKIGDAPLTMYTLATPPEPQPIEIILNLGKNKYDIYKH